MRFYILDILNKIQTFSKKLDETSLIQNNHWVSIDDLNLDKKVYIFRPNGQLLISLNGNVKKSNWEYLGNSSILIETIEGTYLFKSGFIDETLLALKIDGTENFALFINETKYGKEINNINDLQNYINSKYLKKTIKNESSGLFYKPEKINYVEVDNICPACKYTGVSNIQICPNCGLYFK